MGPLNRRSIRKCSSRFFVSFRVVRGRCGENRGRGGIRTHGGFPHARFRVECLKPDSATLPVTKKNVEPAYAKSFGVASAERPISNVQRKYHADDPVCEEAVASGSY